MGVWHHGLPCICASARGVRRIPYAPPKQKCHPLGWRFGYCFCIGSSKSGVFAASGEDSSPCRLQASLTRSAAGMQHTACGILPARIRNSPYMQSGTFSTHFITSGNTPLAQAQEEFKESPMLHQNKNATLSGGVLVEPTMSKSNVLFLIGFPIT